MRKQIAAANWKMNCSYQDAQKLLRDILQEHETLTENRLVIFVVPFPYLIMANSLVGYEYNYFVAAQNCFHKSSGAYTGEVSAEMLHSIGVRYCIVGHSERRQYFGETNQMLLEKINLCLEFNLIPIFCCGEPLEIRESGTQNNYVERQLKESLFHLTLKEIESIVIAYEPIWAIGTGKTATSEQAQQMHAHLRSIIAGQYNKEVASNLSILYGGSVKASNAKELFDSPDVDGGLVGGASLVPSEFIAIIKALK